MARKNATTKSSTPAVLVHERATDASEIKIDIERIAQAAESACEFDRHGGPPILLVNWAGAAVITSTFGREVFWRGVAFRDDNAHNPFAHLLRLHGSAANARGNLIELINNVIDVLAAGYGGLAIVNTGSDTLSCSSTELKRAKCEERGHLIQFRLEREASASGLDWYEDLYNRPAAQLFVETLRRRGGTLYDADNKISIVNEFAMKINNGEWSFYDIAVDEAKLWLTEYFREVRRNLGPETLLMFRSVLIGHVAKAAFREAALACEEAGIAS
jgi:hypothetical protein